MPPPFTQQTSQVVFTQRNHEVQAFPPPRAQQSFARRIGSGTSHGGFEDPQPEIPHRLVKPAREDTIPVVDEKAVGMISRNRCTQLLEGPRRRGL
jgi:hypothetical protein